VQTSANKGANTVGQDITQTFLTDHVSVNMEDKEP